MADRLDTIARTTQPKDYPWRNSERAEDLHPMIETTLAPRDYLELMPRYATELLNAGKTREAIQALMDLKRFSTAGGTNELSPKNSTFLRHHLAIAYLRLGEQENCQLHHNTESCLMPIMGGGIHARPEGSREAMAVLLEEMKQNPDDQSARWWMNIAAMTLGEYPDGVPKQWLIPPKAFDSDYDIKRFHDIAPDLGLDVDDYAGGSIAEDFDGDGYLDIMASSTGLHGQLRYFHNNADGTFSDRTVEAGLVGEVQSLNIVQTDYDNDGRPDVLMLRGGWLGKAGHLPNSLLHNNGDGTFDDVTEEAGMLSLHPTQTAAWFDYDNDGWLDLVIGNETKPDEPKHPCELFMNRRDGTFEEKALAVGAALEAFVKAVAVGDYDNDGRVDVFYSCRAGPNHLLKNEASKEAPGFQVGMAEAISFQVPFVLAAPRGHAPELHVRVDRDGISHALEQGQVRRAVRVESGLGQRKTERSSEHFGAGTNDGTGSNHRDACGSVNKREFDPSPSQGSVPLPLTDASTPATPDVLRVERPPPHLTISALIRIID